MALQGLLGHLSQGALGHQIGREAAVFAVHLVLLFLSLALLQLQLPLLELLPVLRLEVIHVLGLRVPLFDLLPLSHPTPEELLLL